MTIPGPNSAVWWAALIAALWVWRLARLALARRKARRPAGDRYGLAVAEFSAAAADYSRTGKG